MNAKPSYDSENQTNIISMTSFIPGTILYDDLHITNDDLDRDMVKWILFIAVISLLVLASPRLAIRDQLFRKP